MGLTRLQTERRADRLQLGLEHFGQPGAGLIGADDPGEHLGGRGLHHLVPVAVGRSDVDEKKIDHRRNVTQDLDAGLNVIGHTVERCGVKLLAWPRSIGGMQPGLAHGHELVMRQRPDVVSVERAQLFHIEESRRRVHVAERKVSLDITPRHDLGIASR